MQHPSQDTGIGIGGLPAPFDFATFQYRHLRSRDQGSRVPVQVVLLFRKSGGQAEIVCIDARDILPCGFRHRTIERTDNTEIARIIQNAQPGISDPAQHFEGPVGRAVVDHQQLKILIGLRQNAFDTL